MNHKKKLLAAYINEFNINFLVEGAKKYNCQSIIKFLKKKKLNTFTKDKIQNKNLDPWVQNVSINTGVPSSEHQVYNIGQNINIKNQQIWDLLAKKKITSGVWGPMNSIYRENNKLRLYFPDPWNFSQKSYPVRLKYLTYLPSYYAQNYLEPSKIKIIQLTFKFLYGIFINKYFLDLVKFIPFLINCIYKKGLNNYILFLILDLISVVGFKKEVVKNKIQFGMIFLNSIAHYQHNNWDDKNDHKIFFKFTNLIFEELTKIEKNFDSTLVFNGFSQIKTKNEYILRPKNPKKFLKNLNVDFLKLEQDMTNGGLLFFENEKKKKLAIYLLGQVRFNNLNFFSVKSINKKTLFYRIVVKARKLKNKNHTSKRHFQLYNELKNNKKNPNSNQNKELLSHLKFIKSSGKHHRCGSLLFKNVIIKSKKVENHNIFKIIKNYYQ